MEGEIYDDDGEFMEGLASVRVGPSGLVFPSGMIGLPDIIRMMARPGPIVLSLNVLRDLGMDGTHGDYVFSEDAFQRLLERLMEQGGQRMVGMTDSQIEDLPHPIVEGAEEGECAICQELYKPGEELIELPCEHKFHEGCIVPWLKKVATCPVCRNSPLKPEQ